MTTAAAGAPDVADAGADVSALPSGSAGAPPPALPQACDVLVIGAGPAGSAVARTLALAGVDVVLADQHAFPRDKVCGDGLIPDAHHAMRKLGVFDEVMAAARRVGHVGCIGPSGRRIDVPGELAVLPRRELDAILCRAAVDAGARLLPPARFEAPIEEDGRVVGARLKVDGESEPRELRARWLVLATGAVPQALIAAGMCERRTPSGIALRGYVRNEAMVERIRTLDVLWHPKLAPGYGWIFPCPGGVFNVGVGIAHSHDVRDGRHAMLDVNLRDVFTAFAKVHAPLRELLDGGTWLGDKPNAQQALKGAPLRCSLEGARLSRPGLIVTGEAAGSTYAFTGEGIGKALETGIHAAEAILAGRQGSGSGSGEAAVRADYEQRVLALKPRFAMYEKANRVNSHPWLIDLLIWSARRSPRRLKRMAGVLDETHIPTDAVTVRGVLRAIFIRH